jgi:hypothetical protein
VWAVLTVVICDSSNNSSRSLNTLTILVNELPLVRFTRTHQVHTKICSLFGLNNSISNEKHVLEVDDVDLAKEMNELSAQEHEEMYADIHGVAQVHEETLELQAQYLKELDEALEKTAKAKRKTFDRALFFKPTIQNDSEFKLMFLRADNYSAKKAAERMMKYFEGKRFLFGEDKLAKKITLCDLDAQDTEILNSGVFLVLPRKDQSGQPIFFKDLTKFNFNHETSLVRSCDFQPHFCVDYCCADSELFCRTTTIASLRLVSGDGYA